MTRKRLRFDQIAVLGSLCVTGLGLLMMAASSAQEATVKAGMKAEQEAWKRDTAAALERDWDALGGDAGLEPFIREIVTSGRYATWTGERPTRHDFSLTRNDVHYVVQVKTDLPAGRDRGVLCGVPLDYEFYSRREGESSASVYSGHRTRRLSLACPAVVLDSRGRRIDPRDEAEYANYVGRWRVRYSCDGEERTVQLDFPARSAYAGNLGGRIVGSDVGDVAGSLGDAVVMFVQTRDQIVSISGIRHTDPKTGTRTVRLSSPLRDGDVRRIGGATEADGGAGPECGTWSGTRP